VIQAGVYAIADEELARAQGLPLGAVVSSLLAAEPAALQLRCKGLGAGAFLAEAQALSAKVAERWDGAEGQGPLWVINDRADIASLCAAPGLHLGAEDLSLAEARPLVGPATLIGRSTHSLDELREAKAQGADLVGFGPIFATTSKQGLVPPLGLAALEEAVAAAGEMPVVAIGGITLAQIAAVARAGARCAAVISDLFSGSNLTERCRRLQGAFLEAQ